MPEPSLDFVTWDPESTGHINRLTTQREHCGWHSSKVGSEWRDAQLRGVICIYWLALSEDEPWREEYNSRHREAYPDECDTLADTSRSIFGKPTQPSQTPFFPIGHIALYKDDPSIPPDVLDLPSDHFLWIKTLYISHALQGLGIGGSAMKHAELVSASEPLNVRYLLLDTLCEEDQLHEELAVAYFGQVPKFSNESWYTKKGYRSIGLLANIYNVPDINGKMWPLRTTVMRKDLCPRD
ncbi:uncharacterized protein F5Z01DRAFT_279643 [Emericellopsis atlantica]|uniref:N-acetyltransferase domain-containing protein n=1 Tax=Emericellopsis atlantica TaxID=2614577 RepID=A0A9P7ZFZ3_9HYPO|nr:uncharacterized protein F5Z01DRAFT_279643 [Emericellopsis atlantica]KAG9251408.1 hypothetical protein F5Z01DRAFT_279643 [Emericellopsis atlantica]